MEEEAACLMTEEEAGPSTQGAANEDPQPLSENAEEQATTVEEKLQSQQRHIMQLEIQLEESKAKQSYCRDKYSASQLSEKVLRVETGLPDRDTFSAVCEYVARFEGSITYPEENNHNSDKGDYSGSASFGSMWALKKSSRANRLGCQLSSRAIGMMTLSFVVQTTK
ncbi:hypothetical protein JOQ06_015864 [Pogonophryne albipinna]|uniref:Uncharacterized protein n=1 Tax=Pogonophryne albipinna TaxID=1090488 RepID=A0AAD6FBT4_9TELE|nr:hypothetical protein JOQ06_015864 [Pogonophryne albipinna]